MGALKNECFRSAEDAAREDLTLCDAPRGCCLRITRLCSGPKENCRLCALGLTPGTQVRILSSGAGLMRLWVRDYSLALDAALARNVACEFVDG